MIWKNPILNPTEIRTRPAKRGEFGERLEPMKVRAYLVRVRLNSGGYDIRGRYWGLGQPLYMYELADERGRYVHSDHIRATDRAHAKDLIRRRHAAEYEIRFVR